MLREFSGLVEVAWRGVAWRRGNAAVHESASVCLTQREAL